jgi:Metallo-beta-lactamase superfamily
MGSSFEGIARPERDRLSLYVIGSSYGESCIVVLPRGDTIVVDTCTDRDTHLTLDLLRELKISHIDLLLVPHSDLDHVRGLPELLDAVKVAEAWRFPGAADVRVLASKWLRGRPGDRRLRELHAAMLRLDALANTNACAEACADLRPWPVSPRAQVRVTCLAPSQHDLRRSLAALDGLVRMAPGSPKLSNEILRFLGNKSRKVGVVPNVLSLAATVEWRAADVRLVLGGDVERGDQSGYSGWRGILATLKKRKTPHLLRDARAVKVAHHGSRGALEPEAWDEHVRAQSNETWAIIAPFRHGSVTLPDGEVLRDLYGRTVRLAICDAVPLAKSARWKLDASTEVVCSGPVVVLSWSSTGACSAMRGKRAAIYTL